MSEPDTRDAALQRAWDTIRRLEHEKAELEGKLHETEFALRLNRSLLEGQEPDREAVKRVANALQVVYMVDGAHHKQWMIDQMVRHLTGCPMVDKSAVNWRGERYTFQGLGESEEYLTWLAEYCDGEDGPETYEWDEGTPP